MSDLYKAISGSIDKDIDEDIEIRTGEITADNGDGTYDVKIANADSAYPNVETLEYGATFSISEIVIIGFEYGCKESPKILGSAKKIAQEPLIVEVDYSGGARVLTLNAYSITETTTYLNGEISITANIIGNCTRRGFHYGIDTDYGPPDKYEEDSFGAGTYTLKIEGLTANTTYHYQAYVIDANGDEQTGEDKTFMTNIITGEWVLPTGHIDLGGPSGWWNETRMYDGSLLQSSNYNVAPTSWSNFIRLTRESTLCSKVRLYITYYLGRVDIIDIDAYYGGAWNHVFEGDYAHAVDGTGNPLEWWEKEFPQGIKTITEIRIRVYNSHSANVGCGIFEVEFFEVD
ncbi:hypothetical protein ES708_15635 [subsurface metagenome]